MEVVANADVAEIRSELRRILRSRAFQKANRSQRFLSYLVEAAISDPAVSVNEYAVALDVFDRPASYDSAVDATVRVEAGRLRSRLREYYLDEGQRAKVLIDIPKGHYEARFSLKEFEASAPDDMTIHQNADTVPVTPVSRMRSSATEQESGTGVRSRSISLRIALALFFCVCSVVGIEMFRDRRLEAKSSIHSMAVLPLRNLSGSTEQNYLAEGMTDELNTELARIPHLRVISHDSVVSAKLNGKSLSQIGKELDVDSVVEGSVFRYGDKVRITAQLTDARNDQQLWAASFEGETTDLIALQDSVAREIANRARLTFVLGPQVEGAPAQRRSPEAYDAYLRARYFLDRRDSKLSTEYFQRSIDLDPTFASAYAGLAEALEAALTLGMATPEAVKPRALAAAHRAIELDPQSGAAYAALGTIEFTQLWDWHHAEQDLLQGIQLSPGDSYPVAMYGLFLDAARRPEDAVLRMRQAKVMDPLSFWVARNLGSALYFAKRYDEALRELDRAKELQPDRSPVVDNWISWTYEMKGMRREAIQYDLAGLQRMRSADELASLQRTYQVRGWTAYWQLRLRQQTKEPMRECAAYERALDYLRLGERDRTIAQLQQAFDQHCFWMEMVEADPRFDQLRNERQFTALVRRIGVGQTKDE
ncbi:TPR end-of-group domain-containing protein [Granulicella arctica]|uniref:TPR end-of-group domain-containing protein n=1 Tax=Granulicella arctica TaxID=940613 RepID=UPI0021DF43E5|nr:hypothetical protein [Granulicella arctica]